MRRSIATVCLSGTIQDKLEAAAAARFDAVEIFENDLLFFTGSARQVRTITDDLGLEICLFQPFRDFEGVPEELFRRNLDRAERKFDVMEELGTSLMLVCSNVSPNTIDDDELAAAQLHELAERAAKRGLRISYEALAWGTRVRHFEHAFRIVERVAHPHLGLTLDSFHTLSLGDDPAPIAKLPGSKIFFLQIADAPKLSMDVLSWSRHFRCFPGQGDFDLQSFLAAVLRAGYAGPISLEIFNDDLRAAPTRPTAQDGMRSLLFLEEQVRGAFEQEAMAAKPGEAKPALHRVELFDPPPPPGLQGISFIEFAVEGESEKTLGDFLQTLGFRPAGRHRSKDVTLFRQGGINLVLNSERDSFAYSYFLLHGPSICAIGLRADDELQALSRATAFGCTRFEGRVGPNELTIPAVRTLEGSLLYFVGTELEAKGLYAIDFDLAAEAAGADAGAGLDEVDHLAQVLPPGQLDRWVLFYRAVLGLTPERMWELADPFGLVRSRAVSSANRKVRFPLNISESWNTAAARSVSAFGGAGIHHIAFQTDDIFQTVAALQARGTAVLPIPGNYYDDLAARLDIDPALLARLRDLDVLYDRDGSGEFFHVYTRSFQDRFFFEIVQRRGGYDSYGAPNAGVRMAAQAQLRAEPAYLGL